MPPSRVAVRLLAPALALSLLVPAAAGAASGHDGEDPKAPGRREAPAPARFDDALDAELERGRLTEAEYTLERARSLFHLRRVRARYGRVVRPDPRAATALLRDLALRVRQLNGPDRAAAEAILARPTDDTGGEVNDGWDYGANTVSTHCEATFCVHWVETGKHKVPLTEAGGDPNIPDWVETVIATYTFVLGQINGVLGYDAAKSDLESSENGGNGLPDVYLVDVSSDGLYGYCSSDDPNVPDLGYVNGDMSAYCVIDNDFVGFGTPPIDNLQVTAAHEFFHAIQFAYDYFEDRWWMEATATWIEDVLYDAINDNYYFLRTSAIQYPDVPIDYVTYNFRNPLSGLSYGQWLFFRYLTELLGLPSDQDEDIIRTFWERAADRQGAGDPNDYSVEAIERVLDDRGFDLAEVFADFSAGNWNLPGNYEEGSAYRSFLKKNDLGHKPSLVKKHRVKPSNPKTGKQTLKIDHLSSMHVKFIPKKGVNPSAKLLLKVDGPGSKTSPEARYVIFERSGNIKTGSIALSGRGNGRKRVPFGKKKVKAVILVLVNASTRYKNCGTFGNFACEGAGRDDDAGFVYKGALKQ